MIKTEIDVDIWDGAGCIKNDIEKVDYTRMQMQYWRKQFLTSISSP